MFRLVIIDDEPLVLKGIRNIIDWESYGFKDIEVFSNPIKAFQRIEQTHPDVILSDIRMPVMGGLDILRKCREENISSLFVLVSAYSDFEYAKQAIENGAFSYVLKPLNKDAMISLAEKLSLKLNDSRKSDMEKSLRSLVLQTLTTGLVPKEKDISDIPYLDKPYWICFASGIASSEGFWLEIYENLKMGIVPSRSSLDSNMLVGFSSQGEGNAFLYSCIMEALTAFYTIKFYKKTSGILCYQSDGNNLSLDTDEIKRAISLGNYSKVSALLSVMKKNVCENLSRIDKLTFFYNNVLSIFSSYGVDSDLNDQIRPFSDSLSMYRVLQNIDLFFESLNVLSDNILNANDSERGSFDSVKASIKYVDENFTKPITLEQLSDMFHISLSYLCRQFKKVAGDSFSSYMKRLRIEYACSLLENSEYSVANIGDLCGYDDYFYFNKTFKRLIGVTPTKYRENKRNEEKER